MPYCLAPGAVACVRGVSGVSICLLEKCEEAAADAVWPGDPAVLAAAETSYLAADGTVQIEELPSDTQFEQAAKPAFLDSAGETISKLV